MLFNSGIFFACFLAVWSLYLLLPRRPQNLLLLVASLGFYGYWDVRLLGLLALSPGIDFVAALGIEAARKRGRPARARGWLLFSVISNLGILGYFKYANFFLESWAALLGRLGIASGSLALDVVLPVGISFYTFQAMSYTIDIYRGQLRATRRFDDFALFVSFFPQLVAGPIERAGSLLAQIQTPRRTPPAWVAEGAWLVLWGLFKKVYVADNLAAYTSWAFERHGLTTGADAYIGLFAFSIRFYCDFSGYSDIARGLGCLLGFRLSENFRLPYFSASPAELWSRWHITLATWFRDYVYGPLSELFPGRLGRDVAAITSLGLVGLWHGADWKFVSWGLAWGAAVVAHRHLRRRRAAPLAPGGAARRAAGALFTFHLWMLIGAFFVCDSMSEALRVQRLLLSDWTASADSARDALAVLYYSLPLLVVEVAQLASGRLDAVRAWPVGLRLAWYAALILVLAAGGSEYEREFLYFAF